MKFKRKQLEKNVNLMLQKYKFKPSILDSPNENIMKKMFNDYFRNNKNNYNDYNSKSHNTSIENDNANPF